MIPADTSLSGLLKSAWIARVYVASGILTGGVIGATLLIFLTPVYEARMIIAPPSQSSEERSLTILNENPASSRMTSVSSQVSRDYIKFQQTFREISAARILSKYQGVTDKVNEDRIFSFGSGPDVKNAGELSDYVRRRVTIDTLGATTSQVLTYRHPDSAFAEKFLRHLHKITDEMIRNDARQQTENRIAYLQKALHDAYNPEHRKALTDQLMLEERQKMVISMDEPFAAEIVENAASSSRPVWPRASIILPLCLLLGAVLGFLIYSAKNIQAK